MSKDNMQDRNPEDDSKKQDSQSHKSNFPNDSAADFDNMDLMMDDYIKLFDIDLNNGYFNEKSNNPENIDNQEKAEDNVRKTENTHNVSTQPPVMEDDAISQNTTGTMREYEGPAYSNHGVVQSSNNGFDAYLNNGYFNEKSNNPQNVDNQERVEDNVRRTENTHNVSTQQPAMEYDAISQNTTGTTIEYEGPAYSNHGVVQSSNNERLNILLRDDEARQEFVDEEFSREMYHRQAPMRKKPESEHIRQIPVDKTGYYVIDDANEALLRELEYDSEQEEYDTESTITDFSISLSSLEDCKSVDSNYSSLSHRKNNEGNDGKGGGIGIL